MFRACSMVARIAVWLVVATAGAVGSLYFALSQGPIALDWLAPTITESLDDLYGKRFDFSLRAATLTNAEHGPTLSVEGLSVRSQGKVILAAPRATLSVDFRSLLLGKLRVRRLEAFDLELRLAVLSDGAVSISAGADAIDAVPAPPPSAVPEPGTEGPGVPAARAAVLHQAADALRAFMDLATSPDSVIGVVDRLGITHGRLIVDDRTVNRTISYSDLSLSLDKGRGAMTFGLAATGGARRWSLAVVAKGAPGGRRILDVSMRDFTIDEIALAGGMRKLKFDTDAPLALDLRVALTDGDRVDEASGALKIGSGFFRLDEPDHEPVLIDKIDGAVRWDRPGRRFVLGHLDFKAAGYDVLLEGSATPLRRREAAPAGDSKSDDALARAASDSWSITTKLARPAFAAPDRAGGKTVRIDRLDVSATASPNEKKVTLDKVDISGPDLNFAYTGAFDLQHGPHLVYAMTITDSNIPAIVRLWPTHVGGGVRAWFADHMTAGIVRRLSFSADFDEAALLAMRYDQPPSDASTRGEGEIVNATLTEVLPGMAPVTGVSGQLRTTGRSATFAATSGAMDTGHDRRLTMTEGSFTVDDTGLRPAPAKLDLKLNGNVEAVADILAVPAIAPFAALPVEASALKGSIDGRLQVDFDLGPAANSNHTVVSVDANTSGLSIDHFMGAEKLENAAINIVCDRGSLRVTGAGRLYGAPATLDLHRPPGDKSAAQGTLVLAFDDAARAKAGFPLPGVTGPMTVTVKTQGALADANAQVDVDLTKTVLDSPLPGLTKPAGKPGKASFVLTHRPDGLALEQFSLDASGAKLAGVIDLTKDGGLRGAKISQLRLSPGDDARVEIQRGADAMKISVHGSNIDARPLLHSLTQPARERAATTGGAAAKPGMSSDDFDLDFKFPIVTGHGKQILANVDLKMERRGGKIRALDLNGKFGREQLVATMVRGQGATPQIDISSGDGGSTLSFLDFYHKMDSGSLSARVQLGQDRADGVLRIRDFYLKGEPAMRQLMSQGASRTDARGTQRFDPDSVRVARLQSEFGWTTGRLSLRDGVMSGPEMGLTFDGYIDFARERVDVGGSYVPAYDINNLLSNIPVLGIVLAGGLHEGVFALNYRVTGDLSEPTISVNPLSALAPGLMRKMMGVMDGTARPQDGGR